MNKYMVSQDRSEIVEIEGLPAAIEFAENLFKQVADGKETTFTVENEDGYLIAAITNRRIFGHFFKQTWGGPRGDDAITVGEEKFDALNAILLLEDKDFVRLSDNHAIVDDLGRAHIDWPGPGVVHIVDAVCAYFCVDELCKITPEARAYARKRVNPQPPTEAVITLTIQATLRVEPGASVSDAIRQLDYSLRTNTTGVTIIETRTIAVD